MKSKFLSLGLKDFFKGSFIAILTGFITYLSTLLNIDPIPEQVFKKCLISAVIAFLSYIIKNVLTNSNDELLKTESSTNSLNNSDNGK